MGHFLFPLEGGMKAYPTLTPRAGSCADYPKARLDRLMTVMWGEYLEGSKGLALGSVEVEHSKTPHQLGVVHVLPYSFEVRHCRCGTYSPKDG